MKIIIIGASGQIGSLLLNAFKATHEVKGTSRSGANGLYKFDPFYDDWNHLGRNDVLINCVGQIDATKDTGFYRIHVELTELIIKNRASLGNPRVIQISALGASPSHTVEFLRTKGIADQLLLEDNNVTIIRPSIVCTPGTMLVKKMLMLYRISRFTLGRVLVPGGFLQTRIQPVMPDDLVAVVEASLMKAREIIEVVGPEKISFREILEILFLAKRQKLQVLEIPVMVTDFFVLKLGKLLFPSFINDQQYRLLFTENTAGEGPISEVTGRLPASCREFFLTEFNTD